MDNIDKNSLRKGNNSNIKSQNLQSKRNESDSYAIQPSIFRASFKDSQNENITDIYEQQQQLIQMQQQLDQCNEDLESTKSFEIQKEEINEYLDYQPQKNYEIQRIRNEIQNLEYEKNLFIQQNRVQNERHSFPLSNCMNRNHFKNVGSRDIKINKNTQKNDQNFLSQQNNEVDNFHLNHHNPDIGIFSQQNQKKNPIFNKETYHKDVILNVNKKNILKNGDPVTRGEFNSHEEQFYEDQFQSQQSQQQILFKKDTMQKDILVSSEQKIQLEFMNQSQNQFNEGFQNPQESYYARLYQDIKKQYEIFEEQTLKEKIETEEVINSLKKQLKISQEEIQKKQKSLMRILNYYNTLKADYEKLLNKQQQHSIQHSSSVLNAYAMGDIEQFEGIANKNNLNSNSSIASDRGYLSLSKENHIKERQSTQQNIINVIKEYKTQNEHCNLPSSLDLNDDIRRSIDSDVISTFRGIRNGKNNTSNVSNNFENTNNSSHNNLSLANNLNIQVKEESSFSKSQQRMSFIKSIAGVSGGNSTSNKVKYQNEQQGNRESYDYNDDINLFCDDDDFLVKQNLEREQKHFDNFFSPRSNHITSENFNNCFNSANSYDKVQSEQKILEKQYWSPEIHHGRQQSNEINQNQPTYRQIVNRKGQEQQYKTSHVSSLSNQYSSYQQKSQQPISVLHVETNPSSQASSYSSIENEQNSNEKRIHNKSISPLKKQNQQQETARNIRSIECYQIKDLDQESNSFSKQQDIKQQSNYQQIQNKKGMQFTNKHSNPLLLSQKNNIESENHKNQRIQRNINNTQSISGISNEGLPINLSTNSHISNSNINSAGRIQDSFNKLLSKSLSQQNNFNNFGEQITNNEMNNISNGNIVQDQQSNKQTNNQKASLSSSSTQINSIINNQNIGEVAQQKQQKQYSQNLTIQTSSLSQVKDQQNNYFNNIQKVNSKENCSKLQNSNSQQEFQPSPKLTSKNKNFQNQNNQYSSLVTKNKQSINSPVSMSTGGLNRNIQSSNKIDKSASQNKFFKNEKMNTEMSESIDNSIMNQYSQRQSSQGFSSNQNGSTNSDLQNTLNYNHSERNVQQKNLQSMSTSANSQFYTNPIQSNSYNNNPFNSNMKSSSFSQNQQKLKKSEEFVGNQNSNPNSNSTKQLLQNSYQLIQGKKQSNSHVIAPTQTYQIGTTYEDNIHMNTVGNSLQTNIQSHQQQNSSLQDENYIMKNKLYNDQTQQNQQINQNKKLLNEKVNKILQGKKYTNNINSSNTENININTSYNSINTVGMILSPTSKKQQQYKHNIYSQNQNASLCSSSSLSNQLYSSKQRLHTLE